MPFTLPATATDPVEIVLADNAKLRTRVAELERQVQWFQRQIFGQKSERRIVQSDEQAQLSLDTPAQNTPEKAPAEKARAVNAHTRRVKRRGGEDEGETFFDPQVVPVQTIEMPAPEIEGLAEDQYEIIDHKVTHHLAQRPGSYVVLKYVRPVIKLKAESRLVCAAAPVNVLEGSRADVSFLAGMLIDKFVYHLPLYRQHKRLEHSGIDVSRPWLTQCVQDTVRLLEPIHDAQFASILQSRVKAMDETPIKAARDGPGKMHVGYFWPVYGERDEVSFLYFDSRRHENVVRALGENAPKDAVLLSDGYEAYARYASRLKLTHAQCWVHSRRYLFNARSYEPQRAEFGMQMIAKLYALEEQIRERDLHGPAKHEHRQQHSRPIVDQFFTWVHDQFDDHGLLPTNPLMQGLAYIREREVGLRVFLDDPDVAMDTNHLEQAIRSIPMGRRNWLFCWTELGARHVGIVQSLLVTCKLHNIDPYTYLVDVLQRVGQHPAARVDELTPRLWVGNFGTAPLRSRLAIT